MHPPNNYFKTRTVFSLMTIFNYSKANSHPFLAMHEIFVIKPGITNDGKKWMTLIFKIEDYLLSLILTTL